MPPSDGYLNVIVEISLRGTIFVHADLWLGLVPEATIYADTNLTLRVSLHQGETVQSTQMVATDVRQQAKQDLDLTFYDDV